MSEWKQIGSFYKSNMRRVSRVRDPIEVLHKHLKKLAPEAESITQFGVSEEMNDWLEKQLVAWLKKNSPFSPKSDRFKTMVGMALLNGAPATVPGLKKGFSIHYREEAP